VVLHLELHGEAQKEGAHGVGTAAASGRRKRGAAGRGRRVRERLEREGEKE
jgi:hypothetical protein